MQKLSDKQKKWTAIVVGILVAIHFAPGFIHQFSSQARPAKPSPVHAAPITAPPPPVVQISPEVAERAKFLGAWAGNQLMADQNRCGISLTLEISPDDPTKIAGHETKTCMPLSPLQGGRLRKGSIPTIIKETQPAYAELTGKLDKGDLAFTIDKVVGTPPGACELTRFTASPFGPGKILAQWEEGKCGSGHMLLLKTRG